jgi:hypothetical protein
MKYLVNIDLVLEIILNRPRVSPYAAKAWEQIILGVHKFYITDIGLKKISELIKSFADCEADAEEIIEEIASKFEIIEIDTEILQKARQISLNSKSFESAVELVCAKEYDMNAIVTDRQDNFKYINSQSKVSLTYQVEILDINLCHEINILSKTINDIYHERIEELLSIVPSEKKAEICSIQTIVNLYVEKAEKNGGEDWKDYYDKYDIINKSWDNFQSILHIYWGGAIIKEENYYIKFISLWNSLNRFSDIYGYWDQRILWLNRSIKLAYQNNDRDNLFSLLTKKVWTLIMKNQLNEAKECLNFANNFLPQINEISLKFSFYHCSCLFYVREKNINKAKKILKKHLDLFSVLKINLEASDPVYIRHEINYIGDSAKIKHLEGMVKLNSAKCSQDIKQANLFLKDAKEKFVLALKKAKEIDWTRGICYFHNKLVNLNLDLTLKNEDLQERKQLIEEAQKYLEEGKNEKNFEHNLRRKAGYYLAESRLENIKNSSYNGEKEAKIALTIYKKLGDTRKQEQSKEQLGKVKSKYQEDGNSRKAKEIEEVLAKN